MALFLETRHVLEGSGEVLAVPPLILEAADEDSVGPVRQIDRRQHQQRDPELTAIDEDRADRTRAAGDKEAGAAPQKLAAPHFDRRSAGRQPDRASDQSRVDDEVGDDDAGDRLRECRDVEAAGRSAQLLIHEAGREHRDRFGGGAERRAIERVLVLDVDRALRHDAGHGDDRRQSRAKQQQRHEVGGVRHGQSRTARHRNRKIDLPDRRDDSQHQERGEESRLRQCARKKRHERASANQHDSRDVGARGGRQGRVHG